MSAEISKKRKNDNNGGSVNKKMKDVLSEAPRELDVARYAESHAKEIQVLSKKVGDTASNKNVAQKVPVHMRRRAMSHNVKRLPRSIRGMASSMVGDKIKKTSRFHRRRPKNLLEEYNRRRRRHIWLETHIWHAKRFHMIEKWGYKLPWKPTMKSERACYRATSKHCLLQDVSFKCCIELKGAESHLLDGLRHITNPDTGQTFSAVSCLKGTREGHTVIYKYNKYPWSAIGPVSFMWNPDQPIRENSKLESTNQRQLWIWCHPCCFDGIWNELLVCLGLTEEKSEQPVEDMPRKQLNVALSKNDSKEKDANMEELPLEKYKSRTVALNNAIHLCMRSLTGSLLRFSLTGPQSVAVLADAIVQANIVPVQNSKESAAWWKGYYSDQNLSLGHVTQREFMESLSQCQAPSEMPSHCVVAMTAKDPRLSRPTCRTKVVADESTICQDMSSFRDKLTVDVSSSPLWNDSVRDEVFKTMSSDYQIHEMKSRLLVPGLPLDLGDGESRIPVIIIQRPGVTSLAKCDGHQLNAGRGGGFDLVLPKGWGMPFWLALVFRGARVGGIREQECNAFEERSILFPNDYPDTKVGQEHELDLEKEKVEKYNRLPPAKRPNFTKFGILSPYCCSWKWLVKYWNSLNLGHCNKGDICVYTENNHLIVETDAQNGDIQADSSSVSEFYVLRNVKLLRQLQKMCSFHELRKAGKNQRSSNLAIAKCDVKEVVEKEHQQSLVAVKLEMVLRGCPGEFSLICIPTIEDLHKFKENKNYGGPEEIQHADPVLVEKQKLKRQLKDKGIKQKVKVDRSLKMVREKNCDHFQVGSREVIGYLNSGGFSLGMGNGGGVGFVATQGLVKVLNECENTTQGCIVLVRGNSTLQYRFARLSIVL